MARCSLIFLSMRIQQTDRILKDSRAARHGVAQQGHGQSGNVIARAWQRIVGAFKR